MLPNRRDLAGCADAFRSLSSIGAFAIIVAVLMAISVPGMKGMVGETVVQLMGGTLLYAFSGLGLGIVGRRACLSRSLETLRITAWLSLLHLPFGTVAGARALWALRPGR